MQYSKPLDTLRFLAIFMVLAAHFITPLKFYVDAGYFGVEVFFVLSGFLITEKLLAYKGSYFSSYLHFLGRRVMRIFPIYYLLIAILVLLQLPILQQHLLACVTYTFNYALGYYVIPSSAISHFWTLCVEEQFYLCWPFLVLGMKKNMRLLIGVTICIIGCCYAQIYFKIIPSVSIYNWVGLFPRMFALCVGGLGAMLLENKKKLSVFFQMKAAEWQTIFILILVLWLRLRIRFLVCPFLILFWVIKCRYHVFATPIWKKLASFQPFVYLGKISYGIYLYHLPVAYYIEHLLSAYWTKADAHFSSDAVMGYLQNHSWIISFPIFTIVTIGIAVISYHYIEQPILKRKDKFFPTNTK